MRELTISDHDVIHKSRRGDVLRVMKYVVGGGGHKLTVNGFKMTLVHKKSAMNTEEEENKADCPKSREFKRSTVRKTY